MHTSTSQPADGASGEGHAGDCDSLLPSHRLLIQSSAAYRTFWGAVLDLEFAVVQLVQLYTPLKLMTAHGLEVWIDRVVQVSGVSLYGEVLAELIRY